MGVSMLYVSSQGVKIHAAKADDVDYEFAKEALAQGIYSANVTKLKPENGLTNYLTFPVFIYDDAIICQGDSYLCLYGSRHFVLKNDIFNLLFQPEVTTTPTITPNSTLSGLSFYVDAGHGGTDPGAVNSTFGFKESIAALNIALKLGELLNKSGANVFYARATDKFISITARANDANALDVNAFISIHLNSAENKTAEGVETLCYSNSGKSYELATAIQNEIIAATGQKDRGVKIRPDLGVLRLTKMPAVLVETGFISNNEEAKLLFSDSFQNKMAEAIYDGIVKRASIL